MDYNEFADKVKAKYPVYKDQDNYELAQKVVKKYPAYAPTVSFDKAYDNIKAAELAKRKAAQNDPANQDMTLKGAGEIANLTGKMTGGAFAPEMLAKGAVEGAAGAIKERYPGLAGSRIGSALGFAGEAIPTNAMESAGQAVAGKALEGTLKGIKPVINKTASILAQKLGGVSEYAGKILEENAPAVMKYARMGLDEASKAAAAAGKRLQDTIPEFERKLSRDYVDNVIEKGIKRVGPQTRVDIASSMRPAFEQVMSEYGAGLDDAEKKILQKQIEKFDAIHYRSPTAGLVPSEAAEKATLEDAWAWQKGLNKAIQSNVAKRGVYSALLDLKGASVAAFEQVLPELKPGNTAYREGKSLVKEISRIANADDALTVINSAIRRKTNTADSLINFMSQHAPAKEAFDDALAATGGKEFSRWSRYLPNNGLAGAAGLGAGALLEKHGPAAIPYAAGAVAATSPRLYGEVAAATAGPLSAGAQAAISKYSGPAARPLGSLAIQALLEQRKRNGQP